MTETPARPGCTCEVPTGFGAERRHVATNTRCALNLPAGPTPGRLGQGVTYDRLAVTTPVDELGQVRLLLQAAGYGHLRPSAGVRALITDLDVLRAEKARAMAYVAPVTPTTRDTSWVGIPPAEAARVAAAGRPLWRRVWSRRVES